jgi:hypothetical protein
MAKESRLNLFGLKRLSQKRILKEIYLADAQIVRSAPVAIHLVEQLGCQRPIRNGYVGFNIPICRDGCRQLDIEDEFLIVQRLFETLTQGDWTRIQFDCHCLLSIWVISFTFQCS